MSPNINICASQGQLAADGDGRDKDNLSQGQQGRGQAQDLTGRSRARDR